MRKKKRRRIGDGGRRRGDERETRRRLKEDDKETNCRRKGDEQETKQEGDPGFMTNGFSVWEPNNSTWDSCSKTRDWKASGTEVHRRRRCVTSARWQYIYVDGG